jgi:hypothetical protein
VGLFVAGAALAAGGATLLFLGKDTRVVAHAGGASLVGRF